MSIPYTVRARKVLDFANEEALRLNHEYIGTGHLLLGLIREGFGAAVTVLTGLGLTVAQIRHECEQIMIPGPGPIGPGTRPQTPRTVQVIEHAVAEARCRNQEYVGTEHLFLALIEDKEGVPVQVFRKLGAELEAIRGAVVKLLGHPAPDLTIPLSAWRVLPVVLGIPGGSVVVVTSVVGAACFGGTRTTGLWKPGLGITLIVFAVLLFCLAMTRSVFLLLRRQRLVLTSEQLLLLRGNDTVLGRIPYRNMATVDTSTLGINYLSLVLRDIQDKQTRWPGGWRAWQVSHILFQCHIRIKDYYQQRVGFLCQHILNSSIPANERCPMCRNRSSQTWVVVCNRKCIEEHPFCAEHADGFLPGYYQRPMRAEEHPSSPEDNQVLCGIDLLLASGRDGQMPVHLREVGGQRRVFIYIGWHEMDGLLQALKRIPATRPSAHQAWLASIEAQGGRFRSFGIDDLRNNEYFAHAKLEQGSNVIELPVAPSDALCLAALNGTPIYVAEKLLSKPTGLPLFT
jgi:bifunctional DNase/RNase